MLGEKAGLHVMVKLQTSLTDQEILQQASQLGIGIQSCQRHYLNPHRRGEFIFGYAELSESLIEQGIQRLSQVLHQTTLRE